VFAVESIVPYSPLSCVSDHATASSPYVPPPRTPDCFAVPSASQVSRVKTPESSVTEASVSTAQSACRQTVSPTLQRAVSSSSTSSASTVMRGPWMSASHHTDDGIAAVDDSVSKQAVPTDSSRAAAPLDLLQLAMVNVFSSEEQQNQVITDVSTVHDAVSVLLRRQTRFFDVVVSVASRQGGGGQGNSLNFSLAEKFLLVRKFASRNTKFGAKIPHCEGLQGQN